ncbi:MAG TPA: hypothetical protein VM262_14225 [Acidimicrobiales bacterium]|nr:hypothetical protein [Acidimicrobiales bacterium]
MYVVVSPDGVDLEEPDDCGRFHLVARDVGADEVAGALSGFGALEGDRAWIEQEALRTLAEGRVPDDWDDRFDAMVAHAATQGWVDDDGRVQAHVEWEG